MSKSADALVEDMEKAGAGDLVFGDMSDFVGGLSGRIGLPAPKVLKAVYSEHCGRPDSKVQFTTGSLSVTTTSEMEWDFVTEPDKPIQWPIEERLKQDPNAATLMRKPLATESLHASMQQLNAKLEAMGADKLAWHDVVSARLFTGPMHVKYNGVLRGLNSPVPFLKNLMIQLCCSEEVRKEYVGTAQPWQLPNGKLPYDEARKAANLYTTTIHVIHTCIVKLGKLTQVQPVYRGMGHPNARIPAKPFFIPDQQGVMGGVEFGFLSASADRTGAEKESQSQGLILELEQDAISRGADLSWLSQYPHDRTIVFSPLCFLQLLKSRVEAHPVSGGDVLVCTIRVLTNQAMPTIGQMVVKRKGIVADLCDKQVQHVSTALGEAAAVQLAEDFAKGPLAHDALAFNDDAVFAMEIHSALELAKKASN